MKIAKFFAMLILAAPIYPSPSAFGYGDQKDALSNNLTRPATPEEQQRLKSAIDAYTSSLEAPGSIEAEQNQARAHLKQVMIQLDKAGVAVQFHALPLSDQAFEKKLNQLATTGPSADVALKGTEWTPFRKALLGYALFKGFLAASAGFAAEPMDMRDNNFSLPYESAVYTWASP